METRRPQVLISNATDVGGFNMARALVASGHLPRGTDSRPIPRLLKPWWPQDHHVLPSGSEAEFEEGLVRLIDELRPDVLLPLGDAASRVAAHQQDRLAQRTHVAAPSREAFETARDKRRLAASLRALDIDQPREFTLRAARARLDAPGADVTFVVKPASSRGGAEGVRYARSRPELERAYQETEATFGAPLIQDYVPGGPEAMHTLVVLYGPDARLRSAFTMQKVLQWPRTGGCTAVGISTARPDLIELARPFFEYWRWRGPAEVEFKRDPRDGRYRIVEINPRFPGYLDFLLQCGLDVATLTARLALEEDPKIGRYPDYAVGKRYVHPGLFLRLLWESATRPIQWKSLGATLMAARGSGPSALRFMRTPLPMLVRILHDRFSWEPIAPRLSPPVRPGDGDLASDGAPHAIPSQPRRLSAEHRPQRH